MGGISANIITTNLKMSFPLKVISNSFTALQVMDLNEPVIQSRTLRPTKKIPKRQSLIQEKTIMHNLKPYNVKWILHRTKKIQALRQVHQTASKPRPIPFRPAVRHVVIKGQEALPLLQVLFRILLLECPAPILNYFNDVFAGLNCALWYFLTLGYSILCELGDSWEFGLESIGPWYQ